MTWNKTGVGITKVYIKKDFRAYKYNTYITVNTRLANHLIKMNIAEPIELTRLEAIPEQGGVNSINHGAYKNGSIGSKAMIIKTKSKVKDSNGFVWIYKPNHDSRFKTSTGFIMEHVYKIEKVMNKKLKDNQIVHHINQIPDDNNLTNLEPMTIKEHEKVHN